MTKKSGSCALLNEKEILGSTQKVTGKKSTFSGHKEMRRHELLSFILHALLRDRGSWKGNENCDFEDCLSGS